MIVLNLVQLLPSNVHRFAVVEHQLGDAVARVSKGHILDILVHALSVSSNLTYAS